MSRQNIEIISALYEAFARRDQPGIFRVVDSQITVSQTEQLPWGGSYLSAEGLKDFLAKLLDHVDLRG